MPTPSEYNQFRRLTGKEEATMADAVVDSYLNDACRELTSDFTNAAGAPAPVTTFDTLVVQYRPEVILRGAINYWWEYAARQTEKHTQTVGSASQDQDARWTRAMEMIERLEARYDQIQQLGTDITIGNLSRWDRTWLIRRGGQSEESALGDV